MFAGLAAFDDLGLQRLVQTGVLEGHGRAAGQLLQRGPFLVMVGGHHQHAQHAGANDQGHGHARPRVGDGHAAAQRGGLVDGLLKRRGQLGAEVVLEGAALSHRVEGATHGLVQHRQGGRGGQPGHQQFQQLVHAHAHVQ